MAGVVWALDEAGHQVAGADLVLTSDVPVGAGLSSSAALECAVLTALVDLNGLEIALLDRARLARRAENEFVGAPTGLMDQAASTLCTADHALFFDCRSSTPSRCRSTSAAPGWRSWCWTPGLRTPWWTASTPRAGPAAKRRPGCSAVPALRDVDDLDAALGALAERRRCAGGSATW